MLGLFNPPYKSGEAEAAMHKRADLYTKVAEYHSHWRLRMQAEANLPRDNNAYDYQTKSFDNHQLKPKEINNG